MKKMDSYGLGLCRFQAELFKKSRDYMGCSSSMFIRRFMFSNLAKRMDTGGFLFESVDILDALHEIDEQYGPSDYGDVKFSEEELYWAGYIYRYWAYIEEKSSKQVYRIVKPAELKKIYFPYHSLALEQAIDRIKESKESIVEDDIKKGVKILRRVRNSRSRQQPRNTR